MSIYILKNMHRVLVTLVMCAAMLFSVTPPLNAGPSTLVQQSEMDDVVYAVLLDEYNEMSEQDIAYGNAIPSNAFEQVKSLYLIYEGISSLQGLDRFSFSALEELSLSGNRLVSLAGFPVNLPALEMLSLSNNLLTTLSGLPNSMSNLTQLNLSGNAFSSLATMPQNLPKLSILDLSENSLSGAQAFVGMPVLPGLSELSLADNGLTSMAAMPPAATFPTLGVLEFASNNITTLAGMPDYTALPLRICDLNNNQITTLEGFAQLYNANNNEAGLTFNIVGNSIDLTSSQNQALAQNLPGVVFVKETEPSNVSDKTALASAIANATTLLASKTIGTAVGNVSKDAHDAYNAAIISASDVKNNTTVTQAEVDTALTALATATTALNNAVITVGSGLYFSATPQVQIGINPNNGGSSGIFVGLKDINDSNGKALPEARLADYQIEIYYDHNQAKVFEPVDEVHGGLFDLNGTNSDKLSVVYQVDQGTDNFGKLFFVPLAIIGPSTNSTNVIIKFVSLSDSNGNNISIPDITLTFQRGKIVNEASNQSLTIVDAVAGLQYLAQLIEAGTDTGKVNVINMASILPPELVATSNKPNVKDVIALMQNLVEIRDPSFQLVSGS